MEKRENKIERKVITKVKAKRSNKIISPHGGIVPILKHLKSFGVPQAIRSCLGPRKTQAKYKYDDIFIAWVLTSLCGGTRLEHITKLKKKLAIIPGLKIPSHDTLGRVMKQVATEPFRVRYIGNTKKGRITFTDYNDNIQLNRMLIKTTKCVGALKEGISYTLDIDATFINTECRGATRKIDSSSKIGFNPMICLIGELPVFISMRNGNANARFKLTECLENCITLLNESNIKVGKVISDGAGYNKDTFEMLNKKGIKFITRLPYQKKMLSFTQALNNTEDWRKTEIETANFIWDCEIADIPYKMYERPETGIIPETLRVVAMRIPTDKQLKINNIEEYERVKHNKKRLNDLSKNKKLKEKGKTYQDKWKENEGYLYKFFITNDLTEKSEDIIIAYNKRGNAERQFSFMKNDFGWRLPPFMNMNENAVFMIAAALANNTFRGIVKKFKNEIPELRLNARLRDFQYVFINVACSYIKKSKTYIFYNTDIEYELLI